MDSRSALASPPTAGDARGVQVDQAVFTSVRTATGEGYRIVASSGGIGPEEKKEITQRSPSHASLCDASETAEALLSYRLADGRHCVGWARHAGAEHTARGGQRVHTHLVVMDAADFDRFACDPLRVRAALREAVGPTPDLKPPTKFEPLSLPTKSAASSSAGEGSSNSGALRGFDRMAAIVSALLAGRRLVVPCSENPLATLTGVWSAVPLSIRRALALSAGLRFAPARRMDLSLTTGDEAATQRAIRGQDVEWFAAEGAEKDGAPVYREWLALAHRFWKDGRIQEMDRLSACIDGDVTPDALNRTASIRSDLERAVTADAQASSRLAAQYASFRSVGELETNLVERILATVSRTEQPDA